MRGVQRLAGRCHRRGGDLVRDHRLRVRLTRVSSLAACLAVPSWRRRTAGIRISQAGSRSRWGAKSGFDPRRSRSSYPASHEAEGFLFLCPLRAKYGLNVGRGADRHDATRTRSMSCATRSRRLSGSFVSTPGRPKFLKRRTGTVDGWCRAGREAVQLCVDRVVSSSSHRSNWETNSATVQPRSGGRRDAAGAIGCTACVIDLGCGAGSPWL